jgi:hypothetical protein
MFAFRLSRKNLLVTGILSVATLMLASCQGVQFGLPGQGDTGGNPIGTSALSALPAAKGEIVGTGAVRVAMLLPLSAPGNAGKIGKELANAAKLAMQDFGQNTLQLVIKDTAGTAADAQGAATAAIGERSALILGPLFSGSVSAVSSVSLPAKITMVAFSSDPRRARRGVYLMSFSPKADVRRTLNYAISRGNSTFVALLPNGAYGTLAENAMKETFSSGGARLVALAKYDHSSQSIEQAARSIAISAKDATAIYIPDGGNVPLALISALKREGVKTSSKMLFGSGQWESTDLKQPIISGAYYGGRDKRQFASFATRYKAAYGVLPSSTAGLAYDAVSMAAGLARSGGNRAFDFTRIESRNGFSGVNGIFRFGSSGNAQRGLVVYQVQNGKAQVVSQAPSTFGPGS